MFLKFLEFAGIALAVIFFVTQLLIPAFRGQMFFPLFRKQGKLERELEEAKQDASDKKLATKVDKIRK